MTDDLKGRTLGAILLDSQIITPEQVEIALAEQRRTGRRFGEVLVDLGIVSAADVRWGLSRQQAFSFVRLRPENVDSEAVRLVPADVARRLMVVPFILVGEELTVVMDDPTNQRALQELAEITGRSIVAAIGLPNEIQAALDACYGPEETMVVDESALRAEAALLTGFTGLLAISGTRGPATQRALAVLVHEIVRTGQRVFNLGPSWMALPAGVERIRLPMKSDRGAIEQLEWALSRHLDLLSIEDLYEPSVIAISLKAAAGGCRVIGVLPIADPETAMEYLVEQAPSRAVLAKTLTAFLVMGPEVGLTSPFVVVQVSAGLRNALRTEPPRTVAARFAREVRRALSRPRGAPAGPARDG